MRSEPQAQAVRFRQADLEAIFSFLHDDNCVSVVGISNLGKSALLRSMLDHEVQAQYLGPENDRYLFIYVDFNRMLEMTDQAFYELVLRCSVDTLARNPAHAEVLQRVDTAYQGLVAPARDFEIPLRFSQAMAAIGDILPERVVFLFDEIDGPLAEIDGRVFLNLRALRDRHQNGLVYVTATNRRLLQIRQDPDVAEFSELFAHHRYYLRPLDEAAAAQFAERFADEHDVTFSADDLAFLRVWAGGHPGLLETTCHILGEMTGRTVRDASQDWIIHRHTVEQLMQNTNIRAECRKIWNDLDPAEQKALVSLFLSNEEKDPPEMASLADKHVVIGKGPERRIFARAFAEYIQQHYLIQHPGQYGVLLDPEGGEVWVDNKPVPTLTNLEYRLLLLLYGRMGKICTKYDVVEAVWGEDYLDDVDDARIEKLVSRLRQKIEPDASDPRYLLTVRGRGYKLVQGTGAGNE